MEIEHQQQKKQKKRLEQNKKNLKKQRTDNTKNRSKTKNKKKNKIKDKNKKVPETTQKSIPYKRIYPDGIMHVSNKRFSKTIQFYDINYLLAQNDDKALIFENYCDFLNYFDSSISIQLTFLNQTGKGNEIMDNIIIQEQEDNFNDIRTEYSDMLKNQLSKGNNGLIKTKYITFGIDADNIKLAKPRLERIESDILNNFKVMGVESFSLNGKERIELLHQMLNQDSNEKLNFDWNLIKKSGMSTKDVIAPTSFNFSDPKSFRMGDSYGACSFLQILAPELTDRMLADFLDMENDIIVNFHIQSLDQTG